MYTVYVLCLSVAILTMALTGKAQPSLEFASGAGPAGNGPSVANQVITFKENTNNPGGNTFITYNSPTTTATFSLSNPQYTLPSAQISTQKCTAFGAAINNNGQNALASSLYPQMNAISAASDNNFTSLSTIPPGTGISTANNYAPEIFVSALPLYAANAATNGRFYMGDLIITFNIPVANPIIHIVGIGAYSGSQGFTTDLDLQTAGVTLSELSGSPELSVTSNQILNSAANPNSTTGSGAASGSILVHSTFVTSLVFKMYLRGDGGGPWATSSAHSGDQFLIGVSTGMTSIVLPVNLKDFTATPQSGETQLQWTTATEDNFNFFDVQYSTDQVNWQSIGTVKAAGNSNTERRYSFIHSDPAAGDNYYRLRIVDLDNQFLYSPIRLTLRTPTTQLNYYPNPTKTGCTITTNGVPLASVTVMALDGRQLQRMDNFVSGGNIDLSPYPNGIYLIAVKDSDGKTQLLKVLKD